MESGPARRVAAAAEGPVDAHDRRLLVGIDGAEEAVDAVGDLVVALGGGVVVDEGCSGRGVPEPGHELPGRRAGGGRPGVAGVAEVVEVRGSGPGSLLGPDPGLWRTWGRRGPPFSPVNTSASSSGAT
jgi:hypothetical protein